MNRTISLIAVLAICLSLCACGKQDANDAISTQNLPQTVQQETQESQAAQETEKTGEFIALGQDIHLDFAKINFSSAAITYSAGGSHLSYTAQDGMRMFCLTGTIENTGGSSLPVANIRAEMVFNGAYTYTAKATILDSKSFPISLPPLTTSDYCIYAEIPETLLDVFSTCDVRFSLNSGFDPVPDSVSSGEYTYQISLNEETCKAVLNNLAQAHDYFDECPILPTPENYFPVYQASSSSSSVNGKISSIRYSYSVMPGRNDDIKEIYNAYIVRLNEAGFGIQSDSDSVSDVYSGGTKLVSISVSATGLQLEIVPGNETASAPSSGDLSQPAIITTTDTVLTIGDRIETDYVSLTLDEYNSDQEIRSGLSQYGGYRYYTSDNGDPYIYLYGTFKNLGSVPVDIRNIYVQFCFDGRYNYKGTVVGLSSDNYGFINDVAPLSSVNYYMYAAVPQELIDTFTTCDVCIGFTKNFDYKVIDVNDLPQFNYCDDIFHVDISK